LGSLKKGQGPPETVGKLANGCKWQPTLMPKAKGEKNYLVSFSFLAGPRWTCNL